MLGCPARKGTSQMITKIIDFQSSRAMDSGIKWGALRQVSEGIALGRDQAHDDTTKLPSEAMAKTMGKILVERGQGGRSARRRRLITDYTRIRLPSEILFAELADTLAPSDA
jgi:hypothetical protein